MAIEKAKEILGDVWKTSPIPARRVLRRRPFFTHTTLQGDYKSRIK